MVSYVDMWFTLCFAIWLDLMTYGLMIIFIAPCVNVFFIVCTMITYVEIWFHNEQYCFLFKHLLYIV